MATEMAKVKVSEVAIVLARVQFDRRRLNRELDAFCEIDYQALERRFFIGFVNYRELIETVLDRWVQQHGIKARIGVLCGALECNGDQLASG
jgi:uncharacterized protein YlbG (UPF0298 family)